MSKVSSSSSDLTLNCDGASSSLKIQIDNVEKASISSAGAFTSTTIDATKLTGNLPAISGASLTGVGVDGIVSSADATAITITATEQVGIGSNSPDSIVEIEGASPILTITDTDATGANFGLWMRELGSHGMPADGTAYGAFLSYDMPDNGFQIQMRDGTATNDALTITRAGNMEFHDWSGSGASHGILFEYGSGQTHFSRSSTANAAVLAFYNPNGEVGSIKMSGSSTSYATSSDYRLKENLVPITDSIERVKALKPYRFNFLADPDTTVDGFVAHEVAESACPEAISGEKDAMKDYEVTPAVLDDDGTEIEPAVMESRISPQSIDQSKLVPLLTAALQDAIARIEALEA